MRLMLLAAVGGAVEGFLEKMPYVGLYVVLLACGLGLPIPEDLPLILSGYAIHKGLAHSERLMILVGMLGVLSGDSVLFGLGRKFGESIVEHRFLRRLVTPARVQWAETQFEKRGTVLLFAARFMPGARAVLFLTAGIFKVKYWKFVLIDGAAAGISVPLWIMLGSRFGPEVEKRFGKQAKLVILGVLLLVLLGWGIYEWIQHNKRKQEQIAFALTHPDGLKKSHEEPKPERTE